MIDVLEAVYWDEAQEVQCPVVRRRWNPLRRKRLPRREREQSAAKEMMAAEDEATPERVTLDLARRGGMLTGLGHRQMDSAAEQRERAHAAQAQATRRETLAAERETLFHRVRQAATVVAGTEQGRQRSALAEGFAERQADAGLAPWAQGLQSEMGDWGDAATLWPSPEPGLEELDRGFERDARRYDRGGF